MWYTVVYERNLCYVTEVYLQRQPHYGMGDGTASTFYSRSHIALVNTDIRSVDTVSVLVQINKRQRI